MRETRNARIERTMLGYEDHGILTAMLFLDYGGSGQSFGGYALDAPPKDRTGGRVPTELCGFHVSRILKVVGVEKWEQLVGKFCRVDADFGRVYRIGNVLEDNWFSPEAEGREFMSKEGKSL